MICLNVGFKVCDILTILHPFTFLINLVCVLLMLLPSDKFTKSSSDNKSALIALDFLITSIRLWAKIKTLYKLLTEVQE